jgi:hypothetical protein
VRPMFQLCRGRKQFKTNNLRRAAIRRGVSFANENMGRNLIRKDGVAVVPLGDVGGKSISRLYLGEGAD